jgi:hypothetical protein
MRAGSSGPFTLSSVVVIALESDGLHDFVQDKLGGDFSAIRATCVPSTPSHPCSVFSVFKAAFGGRQVTLTGDYVKDPSSAGSTEHFYVRDITDEGVSTTVPPPIPVSEGDVTKSAAEAARWFQRVNLTPSEDLVAYDFSPIELAVAGQPMSCPYQQGFAVIAVSSGLSAAANCANASSQPAPLMSPSAAGILVSSGFVDFTVSSDCRCTAMNHSAELTVISKMPAATEVDAMLVYDALPGASTGFQYLEPLSSMTAQVSNTLQR